MHDSRWVMAASLRPTRAGRYRRLDGVSHTRLDAGSGDHALRLPAPCRAWTRETVGVPCGHPDELPGVGSVSRYSFEMNREEATEALALLSKVVSQARDDMSLQNWGAIWVLHAFTNAFGFAATDVLIHRGVARPLPFMAWWAPILALNLASIGWLKRGGRGTRSFIERQIWSIWTTYVLALLLTALLNYVLGLDRLFMPSVGCVLSAMAFAAMGSVMGRWWYAPAVLWGVLALVVAAAPGHGFLLFGGIWFVTQLTGGVLLQRARRRRAASGAPSARLV